MKLNKKEIQELIDKLYDLMDDELYVDHEWCWTISGKCKVTSELQRYIEKKVKPTEET